MTQRIVPLQTRRATPAGARDPLDTDALADLDGGAFGGGTHFRDHADAFVAADLGGERWVREAAPLLLVTM